MKLFKKLNSKAFSHVEMLVILITLIALGGIGYYVYKHNLSHAGGGYDISRPLSIYSDGASVWVANNNNSITQINASNGAFVRLLSGKPYNFSTVYSIYSNGTNVWTTNFASNSLTEFNAKSGAFKTQVKTNSTNKLSEPVGVAMSGNNLWVLNYG